MGPFWLSIDIAWENSRQLAMLPLVSPPDDVWGRLRKERRNSILMTRHYPDLASASDWSCRVGNLIQPIRSTTQIWVVTRHKYGISALVSQTSFGGETSGSVSKCRLFSQATLDIELKWSREKLKTMLTQNFWVTNKEYYGMLWYFLSVVVNWQFSHMDHKRHLV